MQSSLQLDLLISGLAFPPAPQLWWQQNLALIANNFKTNQITFSGNQTSTFIISCMYSVKVY